MGNIFGPSNYDLETHIRRGDIVAVQASLRDGASLSQKNHYGWQALHWASYKGNVELTKLFLDKGADVVICPRVTDAAVVIGPAAWKYNWSRDQYDELAGALAAGHIIECGAQATGGNYSFFQEVPTFDNIGYPIAEIYEDGSFVVTKHENTGGLVSVGTVTGRV